MLEIITVGMRKDRNSDASSGSNASKKRKRQKMGKTNVAIAVNSGFSLRTSERR